MKTVMKSNKQLRVADDRMEEMRRRGFVEVDSRTGTAIPKKAETAMEALKAENTALRKENAELTAQLDALLATPTGATNQSSESQER